MVMIVGSVRAAHAQDSRVYVDAGVSHARPPAGVDIEPATYALLGGRFIAGPAFGSVYGALATDPDVADWVGGRLGAWFQTSGSGTLNWAVTAIASAFTLGEPTPYKAATARLIPEARLNVGRTTIALRGYGGLGQSDVGDRGTMPTSSVVSDLWMYGGGLELSQQVESSQVWAGLDAYSSASGSYFAGYAGLVASVSPALIGLGFRLWETPGDPELELDFSLSIPFGSRWSSQIVAGRSGPDPLLGSPAAVDGSLVVSWTAWGTPPALRAESDAIVRLNGGTPASAVFRLELDAAESVSVLGSFSDWEEIPMRRQGNVWVAEVPVEPGLYYFGFLVDGEWYVPEDAPGRVTDDFGRMNATLVVPER
jgi:hypothetical protein